jgi:hypothetical protein
MPRAQDVRPNRLFLVLLIVVLLFAFTPISRILLSIANGSFAQAPYSSLAVASPAKGFFGFRSGQPVPIKLTNHTGRTETYHWSASENGSLLSLGEDTLENGHSVAILVPSRGAVRGKMRIALTHTVIFVTVPILSSRLQRTPG